jgi:hypothetical protein
MKGPKSFFQHEMIFNSGRSSVSQSYFNFSKVSYHFIKHKHHYSLGKTATSSLNLYQFFHSLTLRGQKNIDCIVFYVLLDVIAQQNKSQSGDLVHQSLNQCEDSLSFAFKTQMLAFSMRLIGSSFTKKSTAHAKS